MINCYYSKGKKYYLYEELLAVKHDIIDNPDSYKELLDDMLLIGYSVHNTDPIKKIVGFIDNYVIENVVSKVCGLMLTNKEHDRLYIENGYTYCDCVDNTEIKRAYTTHAAETMIAEAKQYLKLDYIGKREFNERLRRTTGHFVALHGANKLAIAVDREKRIIYYDFINGVSKIYDNVDFGGLL